MNNETQIIPKQKKDHKLLFGFLIGAGIVLLLVGLYFGFNYQKNKLLQEGYILGALSVGQSGNLPYTFLNQTTNQTEIGQTTLEIYWQNQCQNYLNQQSKTQ